MNDRTRRRVCELVAGIIATDREFHPDELQFLLRTFRTFGIATGADDEAVSPTTTTFEAAKAMSELPLDVREEAMDLLVDTAVCDGKVVPAERAFLFAVARAAGIDEDRIDERIADELLARKISP
jgi:uncharacterized tellurite resistance protein B-like protein